MVVQHRDPRCCVEHRPLAGADVDAGRHRLRASARRREPDPPRRASLRRLAHGLRSAALLPQRRRAGPVRPAHARRAAARHHRIHRRLHTLVPPPPRGERPARRRRWRRSGDRAAPDAVDVAVLHRARTRALPGRGVAIHRPALARVPCTPCRRGGGDGTVQGRFRRVHRRGRRRRDWYRRRLGESARGRDRTLPRDRDVVFVAVADLARPPRRGRALPHRHLLHRAGACGEHGAAVPPARSECPVSRSRQRDLPALRHLPCAARRRARDHTLQGGMCRRRRAPADRDHRRARADGPSSSAQRPIRRRGSPAFEGSAPAWSSATSAPDSTGGPSAASPSIRS